MVEILYIGYSVQTEVEDGVFVETFAEEKVVGRSLRQSNRWNDMSDKLTLNTRWSFVAPRIGVEQMKYVKIKGIKWRIDSIQIEPPNTVVTTGSVFNG